MKRLFQCAVSAALAVVACAALADQHVYYVATSGDDTTGDGSLENPFLTLNRAVNDIAEGDVISMAEGTYPLTNTVPISTRIELYGAGIDKTFITAGPNFTKRAFNVSSTGSLFHDFTIDGKSTWTSTQYGVGFSFAENKSNEVRRVRITGLRANSTGVDGLAVNVTKNNSVFSHCIVDHCETTGASSSAGGFYLNQGGIVDNCLVWANKSTRAGAGICIIRGGTIVNCTVYGNHSTGGESGGIAHTGALYYLPYVYNTAVFGNTAANNTDGHPDISLASTDPRYGTNLLSGVAAPFAIGLNPVATDDPGFTDPAAGDFTLKGNSPLVDAGVTPPASVIASTTDLAGNPRVQGSAIDIGAYERDVTKPSVDLSVTPREAFRDIPLSFEPTILNVDETAADISYRWTLTPSRGGEPIVRTDRAFQMAVGTAGRYAVRFEVLKAGETVGEDEQPDYLHLVAPTSYVMTATAEHAAAAAYPYDSWETAQTNLLEVMDDVIDGSVVLISEGLHNLTKTVSTAAGARFIGIGKEKTVLRRKPGLAANNRFALMSINHPDSAVTDLTITGGILEQSPGVGITIGATGGLLRDCIVSNNTINGFGNGSSAAVVLSGPQAIAERCIIAGNSVKADDGCAGVIVGGGILRNSLVCDNAGSWGCMAGGVKVTGAGKVENCTIIGNSNASKPSSSGKQYYTCGLILNKTSSGAEVVNTICRGNSDDGTRYDFAPGYPDWYAVNADDKTRVSHCCFGSAVVGSKSFVDDPRFADPSAGDYRLTIDSPCRNAGKNAEWMETATDLDGQRRLFGRRVDLGCYELQKGLGLMILFK